MNHREELNNHIAIQSINNNKIYIYSHPDYPKHNGWLKIGTTSRESDRRIDEQNKTANVTWHLEAEILDIDVPNEVVVDEDKMDPNSGHIDIPENNAPEVADAGIDVNVENKAEDKKKSKKRKKPKKDE